MRQLQNRDFLALVIPMIAGTVIVSKEVKTRGWLTGVITAGFLITFVLWYWLSRIRKYPDDTWRARW